MEKNFIPLQFEVTNQEMVNRFGIKWTPTLIILDPDESEHHRFTGFLPPEDFAAQILFGKGKAEFDLDRFEQAIQCFQEILSRYPKSDVAPEAGYYLGVARYKASHDPQELKKGLEILKRDYPNSEWAKRAEVYALIP